MRETDATHQEVKDRVSRPLVDPGRGKHLWTIVAMFQVTDPAAVMSPDGQILMDRENLLTIEGPGCFKCEKSWTPDIGRRFCQGVTSWVKP